MNFTTPILNLLTSLGLFKQSQEIIIPQDSKVYYELKKAGINSDKIKAEDRKQNFFEKYFKEKVIVLRKQDKKDKLQTKIRKINLKNRIQSQPTKEKQKWTKRLERAIVNNKVSFDSNNGEKYNYLTGLWNKSLFFPKPGSWIRRENKNTFPTNTQEQLIEQLKNSPIFVVENIFNEIVAGEPRNIFYRNFLERLEAKYHNLFLLQADDELKEPCRTAFAFTNPKDAIELRDYLQEEFPYSAYEIDLSVKIMSLADFYKLSRTSNLMNQLKIIPDIKDLGDLLCKFRKKRHVKFHRKQVSGKDFFQGQPLYRLMPAKTNVKPTKEFIQDIKQKEKLMLNYTPEYDLGFLNDITYYFTDLLDAEKAWANFYMRYNRVGISKKPNIEVYNLESLLLDYEQEIEGTPTKFRIVPTTEAKTFIEEAYNKEQQKEFSLKNNKLLWRGKIGINRFMWGLTHRTPPAEYPIKWW